MFTVGIPFQHYSICLTRRYTIDLGEQLMKVIHKLLKLVSDIQVFRNICVKYIDIDCLPVIIVINPNHHLHHPSHPPFNPLIFGVLWFLFQNLIVFVFHCRPDSRRL